MDINAIDAKHAEKLGKLGVTAEMERAIIDWLRDVGALDACYARDGSCTGDCPSGHYCKQLHNNNCICVRR